MNGLSDQEIFAIIRNGGAASHLSAEMPAWSSEFDRDQTRGLVAYLRSFCADAAAHRLEDASGEQ